MLYSHILKFSKGKILLLDDVYQGNANTSSVLKTNHKLSVRNFIIPNNDEEHFQKLKKTEFGDVVVKGDAQDSFTKDISFYYLDYCSTYSNKQVKKHQNTTLRNFSKIHYLKMDVGCYFMLLIELGMEKRR